ncbi:MAG: hypothetical protein Q7R35_14145 [Elusimicrobiota bacterium]|nr:hypothetical protein [Elusimicrobiota bacterium]
MKKLILAAGLICGVFLAADSALAWDYNYSGQQHGNVFGTYMVDINIDDYLPLNSGGSAKALGMGGAFTAVANDLGAVEYNPAGLAQIDHINFAALATASRTSKIGPNGDKKSEWTFVPSYGGAAIKVGPLALGVSRKVAESKNIFQKFTKTQNNIFAPDGWRMYYDTLSDKIDMSGLDTYVLTGALKIGRLSVGANYNAIDGEIEREFSGRRTTPLKRPWWYPGGYNMNDQFQATNKVGLKGYTMDFGALMNMGPLRLGVAAKNAIGKVDVTQKLYWKDNFDMGGSSNWFVYNPLETKKTLTKFAPTYVAGAALVLGKILMVDLDYVTVNLEDTKKAQGRLGAELAVVPGFLFARGGVRSDFKNIVQNRDQKTMAYFVGAGLKMLVLTVDASASLEQAKAGSDGANMTGAVSAQLKF